jgi:hypothetical protein
MEDFAQLDNASVIHAFTCLIRESKKSRRQAKHDFVNSENLANPCFCWVFSKKTYLLGGNRNIHSF